MRAKFVADLQEISRMVGILDVLVKHTLVGADGHYNEETKKVCLMLSILEQQISKTIGAHEMVTMFSRHKKSMGVKEEVKDA